MLSRKSSVKNLLKIPRGVSGIVNVGPTLSLNCCICKGFSCDDWSEDCDGKACCTGELFMRGDSIKICGTCRAVCEDRLLMCDDCGGKEDCESELFVHCGSRECDNKANCKDGLFMCSCSGEWGGDMCWLTCTVSLSVGTASSYSSSVCQASNSSSLPSMNGSSRSLDSSKSSSTSVVEYCALCAIYRISINFCI